MADSSGAKSQPLVSVIIPCFNQAHFLSSAIETILSQTYEEIEVIVVDDGSTDATAEVGASYDRVNLVQQQNRGLSSARNAGFSKSTGDFVIFLDADDRLLPLAVASSIAWLKTHPRTAFVSGLCRFIDAAGRPLPQTQSPTFESDRHAALLREAYIWMPGTVTYRRSILEKVGGFDPSVNSAADHDMYLRIARSFPVHELEEVIGEYRQHAGSMSRNYGLMLKEESRVIRRHRPSASTGPHLKQAYLEGRRTVRNYYGGLLVDQVDSDRRGKRYWKALCGTLTLLRWHLKGFAAILRGAKTSNKLIFSVGIGDPPENWEVQASEHALKLEALFPSRTEVGSKMNEQPNGDSALSLRSRNADPGTVVVFGDHPLTTTVESPYLVTAIVPDDLLDKPASYIVYLRSAR